MASVNAFVITETGQTLIAKIMSGVTGVQFTALKTSTAQLSASELEQLTALPDIVQTTTFTNISPKNSTQINIVATVNNTNLTTGYNCYSVGIFANDPDTGEILFAVSTADVPSYLPAFQNQTQSIYFNFTITVGNSANISLNVDPAGMASVFDLNVLKNEIGSYMSALQMGYYEGVAWTNYDIFPNLDTSDISLWDRISAIEFDETASAGWNLELIDESTATTQTISATLLPGKYNIKNKRTPANYNDYYGWVDLIFSATISDVTMLIPSTVVIHPGFVTDIGYARYIKFTSLAKFNDNNVMFPCSFTAINEQVSPMSITRYSVTIADSTQTAKQFMLSDSGSNITFYVPKKVATTNNIMYSVSDITGLLGSAIPIEIPVKYADGLDFNIAGYTAVLEVYSPENTAVSLLTKDCTAEDNYTFATTISASETETIAGDNRYKVTISNGTIPQIPVCGKLTISEV
jgi:hypothetical protein